MIKNYPKIWWNKLKLIVYQGNTKLIFYSIYLNNAWNSSESVSGPGSTIEQTKVITSQLPTILNKFGIKTILDIPCGDFNWMRHVDLSGIHYLGADIVDSIVEKNRVEFGKEGVDFIVIDIIKDKLPKSDLIFCRDCLVHFSIEDIILALHNIKMSGAKYLFSTSFPNVKRNRKILTGEWRPINLELPPFNLGPPLFLLNEGCTEGENSEYSGKSLGLWKIN